MKKPNNDLKGASKNADTAAVQNCCPCCGGKLIQQVRDQTVQWFCLSCRHEMPNFSSQVQPQAVSQQTVSSDKVRSITLGSEKQTDKAKRTSRSAQSKSSSSIRLGKDNETGPDAVPPSSSVA